MGKGMKNRKTYKRDYYLKDQEHWKAYARNYYYKNKEKITEYRLKNKEKIREYDKKYLFPMILGQNQYRYSKQD